MKTIHRQSDAFAVIPKEALKDNTLSFRTRGVFAFICSFGDEGAVVPKMESKAIKELRAKGLIE